MDPSLFQNAISQVRFARYCAACNNDTGQAIKLYRANLHLSKQLYGVMGIFEVTLRNCIDRYLKKIHGEHWLLNAVSTAGFFKTEPACKTSFQSVQAALRKLGYSYTHDKLIPELSFSFWRYMFSKVQYDVSGNCLINIFTNRPFGISQKQVYQNLIKIVELRNRVAHLEPVCFLNKTNSISTSFVKKRYYLMTEMLRWLGYEPSTLLHEIDQVNEAIQRIEQCRENKFKWLVDYLLRFPRQEQYYSFGQG